jgi:predicted dehydrogenase
MTNFNDTNQHPPEKLKVAVVGAGHWGPGLARSFQANLNWDLLALCDPDTDRARKAANMLGGMPVVESLDELLDTFDVDAVAIATPTRNHFATVMTALGAGKHVLVEEPIAHSLAHGLDMVAEAESRGLVLMADQAACYSPAVLKMQELAQAGRLGEILFVDLVTSNQRPDRPDVDVFWDLAPQGLAILDHVLPEGLNPGEVSAFGADPLGIGRNSLGHLTFRFPNDAAGHIQVNWLSSTRRQQVVISGSLQTLVWDDSNPGQQMVMHKSDVSLDRRRVVPGTTEIAEVWTPDLSRHDPLSQLIDEFASGIRKKGSTLSSGITALRVLSVLEAARRSLGMDGQARPVELSEFEDSPLLAGNLGMERAG